MIFWPSPQICECCGGMGHRLWFTERIRPKVKFIECFACMGVGSHGWIGPQSIQIHRLKKKNA